MWSEEEKIKLDIEKDTYLAKETEEIRTYPIQKNIPLQEKKTSMKINILVKYPIIEKLDVGDSFIMTGNSFRIDYELAKIRKCLKEKKSKIVLTKKTKPIDVLRKILENNYSPKRAHEIASNYARVWRIE